MSDNGVETTAHNLNGLLDTSALFDAHAHLSFAPEPARFGAWATHQFAGAFSTTVTPADFTRARKVFADLDSVKVGVGAHPWWISLGELSPLDLESAAIEFAQAPYIGEVGLDFGKKGMWTCAFDSDEAAEAAQVSALRTIFAACQGEPEHTANTQAHAGRVFSFHAVRSADVIMDLLEEFDLLSGNTIIFHWFSDSGDRLQRARELGCYFSVNSLMLNSRRGREYAKAIPLDRLLIETDLPDETADNAGDPDRFENARADYERALVSAYELIAAIRGPEVLPAIAGNVAHIFGVGE